MQSLTRFFAEFVQTQTILWNQLDRELRDADQAGMGAMSILEVLATTENCRVQDITAATDMTTGGVSQALDRFEQRGWCVRNPHPHDRRSSIVKLSPEGLQVFEDGSALISSSLKSMLDDALSEEEFAAYATATATIRRALTNRKQTA
jgi:DNA-binding MarR family transcriptional regulator